MGDRNMSTENSGLKCSYYEVRIDNPAHQEKPYVAECSDIMEALNLNCNETAVFKEIWRTANARLGEKKQGNSPLRAAEKIFYSAYRIYRLAGGEKHELRDL